MEEDRRNKSNTKEYKNINSKGESNQYHDSFNDDILLDINKSLAQQIQNEMGKEEELKSETHIPDMPAKPRMPRWKKVSAILISILLVVGITGYMVVNGALEKISITKFNDEIQGEVFEEGDTDADEVDPNAVEWTNTDNLRKEDSVINILLVGEEAIGGGDSRGRTDSIMIATVNIKQKSLKLTSLMRDMYVQIPGFSDNKLNAAYHNGGIPLLAETIKQNFDLELDGSILVNFDGFESIIDKLGGVEITLTASEASYLNRTNYISNPAYRNVREGTQTLNGNQALGYSRIRYVRSAESGSDDFGRTSRHRDLLNAIFNKYKSKNATELVLLLNDILPLVQTDISKSDIISYIYSVLTLGATELETFRLPVDNGYTPANIRKMSVLLPDLPKNIEELHKFIFGEEQLEDNNVINLDTENGQEPDLNSAVPVQ